MIQNIEDIDYSTPRINAFTSYKKLITSKKKHENPNIQII